MSLRRRPTDPFRLVCIHDDALDALPDKLMREYEDSNREWSVIEKAVAALKVKPAVFVCDPLKAKFDALATTGTTSDIKAIFSAHIRAIENVPADMAPKFVQRDENQYLDQDYVDSFELGWIMDVAGAIIAKGLGADISPFSLPVTFWRGRTRRAVRAHASAVSTIARTAETASGENSSNV